ncbi:MAG: glycosyltransferase family 2 protein [Gemmatimonadota bacterium]|nr:glycosyltransferase family 2 protein [Gemmatimonadota bacterium]MDH5759860.1 glycosyltransferase family 2 protein [Gemmatimonadota bacterium]
MPALLLILPWVALLLFFVVAVRPPRALSTVASPRHTPLVSVIVPARNEAMNIETCLESLAASAYPRMEIVVVDDRSDDDTGARARGVAGRTGVDVRVIDGAPLPPGWLGKPWACRQGAGAARGDVLLFTDADTRHGPDLLGRAVAALEEDAADLVTVLGRQITESFWERVVQPQMFVMLFLRFFDLERAARSGRWRDVVANGQFMLFRRSSYEALGGHEAVRAEVAEDLALAQHTVKRGMRLAPRTDEEQLATRMYRSLGGLVEGWSKNAFVGGRQSLPPLLRPFLGPVAVLVPVIWWIVPPVALALVASGAVAPGWERGVAVWSGGAVSCSLVLWLVANRRFRVPLRYAPLYPLGALVATYVFLRSWTRGRKVEWKGRVYTVDLDA